MNNDMAANRLFPMFLLGVGLVLLSGLIWYFGFFRILESFSQLNELWLIASLLCLVAATLLGAMNVFILFEQGQRPVFRKFLPIYWLSWAVGLIVPGQVGDMATISWVLRKQGIAISFTLSRAMLDKLVSLMVMMLVAGIGVLSLIEGIGLGYYGLPMWIAFIGVVLVGTMFLVPGAARKFFDPDKAGWVGGIGRTAREIVCLVRTNPRKIALNASATLAKVVLIGCTYWAMFAALGYEAVPVWQVVVFSTLSGLVAYIPVSFNGLGTVEAAGIVLFGQLGIPPEKVLAAYICLRVFVITLAWLPPLIWITVNRRLPID